MFIQNNRDIIRQKLTARNIVPLIAQIYKLRESLESLKLWDFKIDLGDVISVNFKDFYKSSTDFKESNESFRQNLYNLLLALKPWRKGPFRFFDIEIQSEWNSAIKFNLIANHLNIKDKIIADIGCNNGYYMFRMLPFMPKKIIGFEPSAFCKAQFELINSFIKSHIAFELLGIEDLVYYDYKFDCIICLGVIYHRTNPLNCLKILKNALNAGGEVIIDTLIIEDLEQKDLVLSPLIYAKMKNVYFIPSVSAFQNWLKRVGFRDIELIAIKKTTQEEQSKSAWIDGESLGDFLDKDDLSKTIEGYPAPIRAYFKAKI